MNVINFLLNLLNVHLWDIAFRTKLMFVTIHALTNFLFLGMLFSLKISHSSLLMLSLFHVLPNFDALNSTPEIFKPRIVYE